MDRTISSFFTTLAILALASLTTACHHELHHAAQPVQSDVSYRAIPDKSLGHYEVTFKRGVEGAVVAKGNPAPLYPPSMIPAHHKDVEIEALLIVTRDGHVREVRVAADEAEGTTAPFALAVAAATLHWHFSPLRLTSWEDLPDGGIKRVASTPEPFSQRYLFRFTIVDGKPKVTTGRPDNAS